MTGRICIKVKKMVRYMRPSIAFLLAVSALLNITFAWFEFDGQTKIYNANRISVSADGLTLQKENGEFDEDVTLTCDSLAECSSQNGRDFFFPLGADKQETDDSVEPVKFRRATANDRNTKYISMEFTLLSDRDTNVWLSNESYIWGVAAPAIRLSIDFGEGENDWRIFDASEPGGFFEHEEVKRKAVSGINSDGSPNIDDQVADPHSLGDYFYTGIEDSNENVIGANDNKLFSMRAGEARKIVVNVWLEGFDSDCNADFHDKVEGKSLKVQLKFTAGIAKSRVIKFSDVTFASWAHIRSQEVSETYDLLKSWDYTEDADGRVYVRDTETNTIYAMVREIKTETTTIPVTSDDVCYHWTATLPSSVTSVEFIRFDYDEYDANENNWEFWKAGDIKTINKANYYRFYAYGAGEIGSASPNVGVWSTFLASMTFYFIERYAGGPTEVLMGYEQGLTYYSENVSINLKMKHFSSTDDGINLYGVRIIAVSDAYYYFELPQRGLSYTGMTRPSTNRNCYRLTLNANGNYGRAWVSDLTNYPVK